MLNPELPTVLCIASYEKGHALLAELAAQACNVVLLTAHKHRQAPWPALSELHTFSDVPSPDEILRLAQQLARHIHVHRVIALDEFDLEAAALIREDMQLPGMGSTTTRNFRDKLAMRTRAKAAGIAVPDFISVHNYDDLASFLKATRGPWLLKPRTSASAIGIRRIAIADDLWRTLDELGDEQVNFLLERFIPGAVYHVDSITWQRQVLAQSAQIYGVPPMSLMQQGGVFTTRTLDRTAPDTNTLCTLDAIVVPALGMVSGVTHSEYIRADDDGTFYFLETAARVGGAYIAELVEFSTGMNPWVEWARIEAALLHNRQYTLPQQHDAYAGSVICLAKQDWPDLSTYNDPEIVLRMNKHHHAGLIVRADIPDRVKYLVENYRDRFQQDFCASMPPPARPTA